MDIYFKIQWSLQCKVTVMSSQDYNERPAEMDIAVILNLRGSFFTYLLNITIFLSMLGYISMLTLTHRAILPNVPSLLVPRNA